VAIDETVESIQFGDYTSGCAIASGYGYRQGVEAEPPVAQ
jgi:hypothetical protein